MAPRIINTSTPAALKTMSCMWVTCCCSRNEPSLSSLLRESSSRLLPQTATLHSKLLECCSCLCSISTCFLLDAIKTFTRRNVILDKWCFYTQLNVTAQLIFNLLASFRFAVDFSLNGVQSQAYEIKSVVSDNLVVSNTKACAYT
jgi:hypothetical protein